MKTLILIICLFVFTIKVNGQLKNKVCFSLSESFSKEIISNKAFQFYSGTNLNIGYQLNNNIGSFNFSGMYSFSGNFSGYDIYDLQSHFLGGSIKYTFRNIEKKIRTFIKVSALTEIYTNYRKGFLIIEEFRPIVDPSAIYYTPSNPGGEYKINYYYSNFYHSTPFVGSLVLGIDIKLIENLNLNVALGCGVRIMKVKYAEWKENDNIYERLETIPTKNIRSQMLDIQLGLTYAFSFKKKPENTKN